MTKLLTMEFDDVTPEQLARLRALSLPTLHWAYEPMNAPRQVTVRINMWGTIGLDDARKVLKAMEAADDPQT